MSRKRTPGERGARARVVWAGLLAACAGVVSCGAGLGGAGERPATAEKWFRRAQEDFNVANIDEARDSVKRALSLVPKDAEVRILAARIALSRLDYDETLRLLKGAPGSEAAGLRGRALWYKGDLDAAADELEVMLGDPDVRDEWARSIAKLARMGSGREPFTVSGAILASVEMPHVSPLAPFFVVPVELDGEPALAMVSTGTAEVVVDSATRAEPSWISLRFDKRLEVHDVPAMAKDLSGLSNEAGTRIKVLLGVNLLRHLNATVDYGGRQFVARSFSPPPPPHATRVSLFYARGGGMLLSSALGDGTSSRAAMFVDSSMRYPIALDQAGWKKAGLNVADLTSIPNDPSNRYREGVVPMLRLGAYDLPKVQGIFGAPIEDVEKGLEFDIDGIIGSALLAHFRLTFADGGRLMWIEDEASKLRLLEGNGRLIPTGEPPPEDPGSLWPTGPMLPLDEGELPPTMPPPPGGLPPAGPGGGGK
jgi:hypothetical protein